MPRTEVVTVSPSAVLLAFLLAGTTALASPGEQFRISDMAGTGDPSRDGSYPAVTYASRGQESYFLVVWNGEESGGGFVDDEYEIFGQMVSTTGVEIGDNDFRISDMGGTGDRFFAAFYPAVAYNSQDDELFVVWMGSDDDSGLVRDEYEIFGQRLDAGTGLEIGTNDFRISEMGGTGNKNYDAIAPAVAYNSQDNEYLVVWFGDTNVGGLIDDEREAFGQRLDAATGSLLGGQIRISEMGGTGSTSYSVNWPAVAYDSQDNEYLVVWRGQSNVGGLVFNEWEIFGQRLDAATGLPVGTEDFRISNMGGTGDPLYDADLPAVSYDSQDNEYLVVWTGQDDVGGLGYQEYEIFGQRIAADTGLEIGDNDFRISAMGGIGDGSFRAFAPEVSYDQQSNEVLVVWFGEDSAPGEREIFGQRLAAATGLSVGEDFQISEMGGGDHKYEALDPAVAFGGSAGEYLVAWDGDTNVGGLIDDELEIFGALVWSQVFADGFESGDPGSWSTIVP